MAPRHRDSPVVLIIIGRDPEISWRGKRQMALTEAQMGLSAGNQKVVTDSRIAGGYHSTRITALSAPYSRFNVAKDKIYRPFL